MLNVTKILLCQKTAKTILTKLINNNKFAERLRLSLEDQSLETKEREEIELKYDTFKKHRFNKILLPKLTQVIDIN